MKRILYTTIVFCGFCFLATNIYPQGIMTKPESRESLFDNKSYVQTITMKDKKGTDSLEQFQYFDRLRRLNQVVQKKITPNKQDLATLIDYDFLDREERTWLPAIVQSKNNASLNENVIRDETKKFYNDSKPYSLTIYNPTSLGRIEEQYGPGQDWIKATDKRPIATEYLTNTASGVLACALFTVDGTGTTTKVKKNNYYAPNELYVTKITDEDKNVSYEFKDKLGQVVLTRQMVAAAQHDTYYVYDDYGNLCFVLPPLASDGLIPYNGSWDDTNATGVKQYAYIYKYDNRNRCIQKKLPGCDPIFYIYDKADRLIFTQDGEQKKKGEWAFSISDVFGRPALTGVSKNVLTVGTEINAVVRATLPDAVNGTYKGYNVTGVTLTTPTIYSANYYDNYNFKKLAEVSSKGLDFDTTKGADYNKRYGTDASLVEAKGQLTGSIVAQFNNTTTVSYLYSAMYYDNRARLVQSQATNHLAGGKESEYIAYNFTGQPTQKLHIHTATGQPTQTELYAYTYDHAGRLLDTKHKLNTGAETLIASNTYDELGRLKENKKGNNANLNTAYTYNIRSWTTSMKSNILHVNLDYTHGGNIKTQSWTQESKTRKYDFAYDNLSRLTAANFTGMTNEQYQTAYSYDKHGNMNTIQRFGKKDAGTAIASFGLVDNLALSYNGNQLRNVHDPEANIALSTSADFKDYSKDATKIKVEYAYNANGAMTQDLNKGISTIQYNSLNLPTVMDIKSPVGEARNEYNYSAGGQKLKVVQKWNPNYSTAPVVGSGINVSSLTVSLTTDYVGNKIYENNTLKRILIDGGYIEGGKYYYYLTDHLGNNRAVAEATGAIIQRTHYYPFGMAFAETTGESKQPYKYNGKELDAKHGLNMYDYSARYLDNAVPRFTSVDPHAENYYSWSPYAYVGNNPMRLTDPTGKDWKDVVHGALSAVSDNLSIGLSSTYSKQQQSTVSDANDYNTGRVIGDMVSVVLGVTEVVSGTGAATGGVITSETGVGAVVGAIGVAKVLHGAGTIGKALQGDGKMEASGKGGGKKYENKDGNNKPTKNERALEKKGVKERKSNTRETNTGKDIVGGHRTGKSNSKKGKHEQGETRRDMDQNRKEKGDKNRQW